MEIRPEQPGDAIAIHQVNTAAFGRPNEADLVDRLREVPGVISWVAVDAEIVIGHLLLSPVELQGAQPDDLRVLGLGPIAVLPQHQRQGVGTALIEQSLAIAQQSGYQAIVVLGHPEYYPRFGFIPASQKGLRCEYPVPDEVFMVRELVEGALTGIQALVKYHPEFQDCE